MANIIISSRDSLKFNDYVTIQINCQELLNLPQLSLVNNNNIDTATCNTQGEREGGVLAIYLYIIQRFVELNSQSFTGNRNGNEPLEISASSRGNLLINSCRALMRSLSLTLSLYLTLSSIMQATNSVLSLLRKVSVYGLQRSIESSNDKKDVGQCE